MKERREVAEEFVSRFCAGDVGGLAALLAPDLRFKGPLFEFSSAAEYLHSLSSGPPEPCGYRLISVSESNDSVAIFYDYEKPDLIITIAQLFKFRGQQISEILLVFDGRGFS